jgi:5-hydroxyisourate hydrolase
MAGKLNTHVLDTAHGRPAAGMRVELFRIVGDETRALAQIVTNADGRSSEPLLAGEQLIPGTYQLNFNVADYFAAVGSPDAGKFLGIVPVRFIVDDPAKNYHVPLIVTPWSYGTYRGS